jgi:hypothetical protein
LAREPTEAQVEAIRRAMSPEKFVSHMRAIDCWVEGWHAAEPQTPSELHLVGARPGLEAGVMGVDKEHPLP